jgi:hypothetical protein
MTYPNFSVIQTALNADIANGNILGHFVRVTNLGSAQVNNTIFRTNANDMILDVSAGSELGFELRLFEGVTVEAIGNAKTAQNRDRRSVITSVASISNSGSTSGGTELGTYFSGAGRLEPKRFILVKSTDYSFQLVNRGAASAEIGADWIWKEI